MTVPSDKDDLVSAAREEVIEIEQQYLDGAITEGERYNKVVAIWSELTESVADAMFRQMEDRDRKGDPNPIYMMADSGARGSIQQIRQLAGMRGLMAKPSGEIIETPITANFREGLSVAQYFISTPRRPQGPGRYGAQDGRLRLPDAPPRGRGARRHCHRERLRHHRGNLRRTHRRQRRDHRAAARSYRRPSGARGSHGSVQRGPLVWRGRADRCRARQRDTELGPREGEDSLGAELRDRVGCVSELLRTRPLDRTAGRAGDRRGCDCRPVDR